MKRVTLRRVTRLPAKFNLGTFGVLSFGSDELVTVEQDWEDNKPNISCIPTGVYQCTLHKSPTFGMVYKVLNVPDRTDILIHVANFASELKGCIAPGIRFGAMGGVWCVSQSGVALQILMKYMDGEDFELEILE